MTIVGLSLTDILMIRPQYQKLSPNHSQAWPNHPRACLLIDLRFLRVLPPNFRLTPAPYVLSTISVLMADSEDRPQIASGESSGFVMSVRSAELSASCTSTTTRCARARDGTRTHDIVHACAHALVGPHARAGTHASAHRGVGALPRAPAPVASAAAGRE